jgi:hypothetical protein
MKNNPRLASQEEWALAYFDLVCRTEKLCEEICSITAQREIHQAVLKFLTEINDT